jgi:hypothetical protein
MLEFCRQMGFEIEAGDDTSTVRATMSLGDASPPQPGA